MTDDAAVCCKSALLIGKMTSTSSHPAEDDGVSD
jgi:hypothetical protein